MTGSNDVFNIARGKVAYYGDDLNGLLAANSRLVIVILEVVEADDTLNNHDTLDAILMAAGNTEATSTNYARIELDDTAVTYSHNDTSNDAKVVIDSDQVFSNISQMASETWVKLLMCWDGDNAAGDDTNVVPLTYHTFDVTPNGGNITADFDQTAGFYAVS